MVKVRSTRGILLNWEALGALAETLGAAAVVATLLYLSHQVRQGLKDARAEGLQQLSRDYSAHSAVVMSDENVGPFVKGLTSYESLAPEERLKFDLCATGFVNIVENAIYHSEAGRLDEVLEMLEGNLGPRLFSYPGFGDWWLHGQKCGFAKSTQQWVDRQLASNEGGARFWHFTEGP
jgi:hypothetical protein